MITPEQIEIIRLLHHDGWHNEKYDADCATCEAEAIEDGERSLDFNVEGQPEFNGAFR